MSKLMGWGALALRNGEALAIASQYSPDYWSIGDLPFRVVFESAARRVRDAVGSAPEYLAAAQLSGSYDRTAFEHAFKLRFAETPEAATGELEWSHDEFRARSATADWTVPTVPIGDVKVSSYWTVKEFVAVCVGNGLGVHFGW